MLLRPDPAADETAEAERLSNGKAGGQHPGRAGCRSIEG
jgi:hypothetical protein